ncbi:MAG: SMP-30/gluconolactonase/LRE family protein [Pseudomonadota bacterium]
MSQSPFEVLAEGFFFLEGPRWHEGRLWMSDMLEGSVYAMTEQGEITKISHVPGKPSGLNFLPDGRLVVVSMNDRCLMQVGEAGALSTYCRLGDLVTGAPNDSVVDHAGNIFVGNFGFDLAAGEAPKPANLVRVAPDGSAVVAADDMMFPNGTVITPDGATLICAETFASRLTAFTREEDGRLTERRVWADLGTHNPDGICLDADGAVWVSSVEAGLYLRVAEGGEILQELKPNGARAVACALGGADGRTLFALTFDAAMSEMWHGVPKARVEVCRVDIPGAGFS